MCLRPGPKKSNRPTEFPFTSVRNRTSSTARHVNQFVNLSRSYWDELRPLVMLTDDRNHSSTCKYVCHPRNHVAPRLNLLKIKRDPRKRV